MANDVDDLDGPKATRSRRRGREPIIVDLGHPTIMPGSVCEVEG